MFVEDGILTTYHITKARNTAYVLEKIFEMLLVCIKRFVLISFNTNVGVDTSRRRRRRAVQYQKSTSAEFLDTSIKYNSYNNVQW